MDAKELYRKMYQLVRLRWEKTGSFNGLDKTPFAKREQIFYNRAYNHLINHKAIKFADGFISRRRAAKFRELMKNTHLILTKKPLI